jgi:transposase
MTLHRNAKLGLAARLALVQAIEGGMSMKAAAAAFSVSPATAHRWWHRWREASEQARSSRGCLLDRSSRPHHSPRELAGELQERSCACRRETSGPVRAICSTWTSAATPASSGPATPSPAIARRAGRGRRIPRRWSATTSRTRSSTTIRASPTPEGGRDRRQRGDRRLPRLDAAAAARTPCRGSRLSDCSPAAGRPIAACWGRRSAEALGLAVQILPLTATHQELAKPNQLADSAFQVVGGCSSSAAIQ